MKPNQKVQLTLEAFNELQAELNDLKNNKVTEVTDRVAKAREFGDISENSEYDSAQEELAWVHGRIEELSDILNRAQIVQATTSKSEIGVGSIVHVEINGTTHEFTIVGEWEADPAAKKISQESPLGRALLGKKINEAVEVEAPAGKIVYHIKAIK